MLRRPGFSEPIAHPPGPSTNFRAHGNSHGISPMMEPAQLLVCLMGIGRKGKVCFRCRSARQLLFCQLVNAVRWTAGAADFSFINNFFLKKIVLTGLSRAMGLESSLTANRNLKAKLSNLSV